MQQKFEYSVNYQAGISKLSNYTKPHVPNWFTLEEDKQNIICWSRLFSRQKIVLSTYQNLKFANFDWCSNWSHTVRLCSTTASQKCRRSEKNFFSWRWSISYYGSKLDCQNKREKRLKSFKMWTYDGVRLVQTRWCCSWVCGKPNEI